MYYGSSNEFALKGVELDRRDFHPISKIQEIMMLRPEEHGWERFGMNNDDSTTLAPFTEGAFVTKHNGKYYFQYGAPGTEFKGLCGWCLCIRQSRWARSPTRNITR